MNKKILAIALIAILTILIGAVAFTENENRVEEDAEARIAALEERVADLEARLQALESGSTTPAAPAEPEETVVTAGEECDAGSFRYSVLDYDFGSQFSYYANSSYRSKSLYASNGYQILAVQIRIDNKSGRDLDVNRLLQAEAVWSDGSEEAYGTFFCEVSDGVYSSSVRSIASGTSANGILLFAVPEKLAREGGIAVLFDYADTPVRCVLRRNGGVTLPSAEDSVEF